MSDPKIWQIEDHTKAKHALLRRYLGGWFPVLTAQGYNRRVIYLDGFAGPGILLRRGAWLPHRRT